MATDFLSQDEVDVLMKGMFGGDDEKATETAGAAGAIRPYDLATQERIVRGRMPTLEIINERFSRLLRIGLFNFMRRTAEISVSPVRVIKYQEFVRNLVVPTNLNLVHIRPLRGTSLFIFDPNLVFMVVDQLYGGDGRFHMRVEGRDFSNIEMKVIHRMIDVVFAEYEKAWKSIFEIKCNYVRSEVNTQFANIVNPSEVVVTTTFTIELGAGGGAIHICIPYSSIEPIRDTMYSSIQGEGMEADDRWVRLLGAQFQDAKVNLVATLASGETTLGDILNIEAGDVIPLDIQKTIVAGVDGVPLYQCRSGVSKGHHALKIEEVMKPASRLWEELKENTNGST